MFIAVGGVFAYSFWRQSIQSQQAEETVVETPQIRTVTALGRLEPKGEIVKLSAPSSTRGNRVEQLLVQEGNRVEAGQVVAILDSRDQLQAAYDEAQAAVRAAEAQLAITEAGAKRGEIAAQRAEIERLEAQQQGEIDAQRATVDRLRSELRNAETEFRRYEALYQQGAISASERDSRRLALETAQKSVQEAEAVLARIESTSPAQLNQARAELARIEEVRPVDVNADRVEVDRAIAAMHRAKAELDQSYVRIPTRLASQTVQEFTVLEVHTRAGEVVSDAGIVDIGHTQQMYAVAEVYQSDISHVQPGQSVTVTSDSIPGKLTGTVERIDSQVRRQQVINTDPTTNTDARVIEVHIALDAASSQKAAHFTNLQVTTVIKL
jgi:HlyD family secretion protein